MLLCITEPVERFIDAIGGIDVESEYEFTPVKLKSWTVKSLTIPEQLTAIIGRVPERYTQNDLSQLYVLKEKYPSVYKHWKFCRENYWEGVALLLERGIKEGSIRPVSMPILKTMFQATVEQFFQKDVLVKNHIPYREALSQVADILVNGIIVK